jgi:protein-tyrosine phosphatase
MPMPVPVPMRDGVAGRERHLDWEGAFNVRDLGGFQTADGRTTRWGAVVRSDSPDRLTEAGWSALQGHGIRTIVDLRHPTEQALERVGRVPAVQISVLDFDDAEFWHALRGVRDTPRFYRASLERWNDRFGRAFAAVARAEPGGVLVHCQVGRDRTGLLSALLLSAVGVPLQAIDDDYALSRDRLVPLYAILADEEPDEAVRARLAGENVSPPGTILAALEGLDVAEYLEHGGVTPADVDALRARLLE